MCDSAFAGPSSDTLLFHRSGKEELNGGDELEKRVCALIEMINSGR